MRQQHEITTPGPLIDARGKLREPGWARQPLLDANVGSAGRGALRRLLNRLRIKRWDYYALWTPELFASATLAHLGYAGLAFLYVVDLLTGRHTEHSITRPFGHGIRLPRNSGAGDALYDDGRTRVLFSVTSGGRRLHVSDPEFEGGRGLRIDLELVQTSGHESIVVCTPMPGGCFYYNRKINGMPADGTLVWGGRTVRAMPREALGQLDWGCGIWPYRTRWIWASANGFLPDGRITGLNLGGGFGDLSFATENALFIGGRLHKLGDVRFVFEPRDYRKPWRFADDAGRIDLELVPATERVARTNLGIVRSEVHQLFGRYSGHAVADDGERITLRDFPGFAEEHYACW